MKMFLILSYSPFVLLLIYLFSYGYYFIAGGNAVAHGIDFDDIHSRALAILLLNISIYSFCHCLLKEINPTNLQIGKVFLKFLGLQILYFVALFFLNENTEVVQQSIRLFTVGIILFLVFSGLFLLLNLSEEKEYNGKPWLARIRINKELNSITLPVMVLTSYFPIINNVSVVDSIIVYFWFMSLLTLLVKLIQPRLKAHKAAYDDYLAQLKSEPEVQIEKNQQSEPSSVNENIARYKAQQRKKAQQKEQNKWKWPFDR